MRNGALMLGLYGGAFDPPHRGHVELARRAKQELGIDRLLVLVVAAPGHKPVATPAETRLRLARAAFPDDEVMLDEHPRTVDTLRALSTADARQKPPVGRLRLPDVQRRSRTASLRRRTKGE